jgi:hypothetical protein
MGKVMLKRLALAAGVLTALVGAASADGPPPSSREDIQKKRVGEIGTIGSTLKKAGAVSMVTASSPRSSSAHCATAIKFAGSAPNTRTASILPECDAVHTSVPPPPLECCTAENNADLASGEDMFKSQGGDRGRR